MASGDADQVSPALHGAARARAPAALLRAPVTGDDEQYYDDESRGSLQPPAVSAWHNVHCHDVTSLLTWILPAPAWAPLVTLRPR